MCFTVAVTECRSGPTEQNMTVSRDWLAELLERWRREIVSEPYRHSAELREAIRRWVDRQQQAAGAAEAGGNARPPQD